MSNQASFQGVKYNIVEQDDKYVVLERCPGWQTKHLKDEVIFENEPEEMLPKEMEAKDIVSPTEDTLSSTAGEPKDLVIQANEGQEEDVKDPAWLKAACEDDLEDSAEPNLGNLKEDDDGGFEYGPQIGIDVSTETQDDRDSLFKKRIKDFSTDLHMKLEEIINEIEQEELEKLKIEEEGAAGPVATGAAAGPGTTTAGVANVGAAGAYDPDSSANVVPSRLGIGTKKRPLNEGISKLNRHFLANYVEQKLEPLQESETCSVHLREKARKEVLGNYPTLLECAKFISENKYVSSENKYIKRNTKLDEAHLVSFMKKLQEKMFRVAKK